MNERGQYGKSDGTMRQPDDFMMQLPPKWEPWTESQRQAFQRSLAVSAIGSVAGAVLWKDHRVWGFILGGIAGNAVGSLAFTPPTSYPWRCGRAW